MASNGKRSPEEIRSSIRANRAQLGIAVETLRGEIQQATDWRRQLRENHETAVIAAAGAGFVLGGGLGGLVNLVFRR